MSYPIAKTAMTIAAIANVLESNPLMGIFPVAISFLGGLINSYIYN